MHENTPEQTLVRRLDGLSKRLKIPQGTKDSNQ